MSGKQLETITRSTCRICDSPNLSFIYSIGNQYVNNFIDIIDQFENYFLLLSNQKNTIGIERSYGDFVIHNDYVRRWMEGDPVIFFSGLQILNPKIFDNFESTKFSMNKIWDKLILEKKLKAKIMKSKLFHIGDIKTFNKIIS